MNLKQETLGWLAELPDESPRWRELHDEIALVRSLEAAEDDILARRVYSPDEVTLAMREKWATRNTR